MLLNQNFLRRKIGFPCRKNRVICILTFFPEFTPPYIAPSPLGYADNQQTYAPTAQTNNPTNRRTIHDEEIQ